jgi:hypothetical protein
LKRNLREDVIVYFETMARILAEQLPKNIKMPTSELSPRGLVLT